ncbi:hypothetical protein BT96DRAFT_975125 [Gymnopus androsaceus JB14]|uniref:F-box domain-containing protein n=1 Tax=Gymnopus androsaceus JB14 TaxID=1447944 RepID=A0A6A4HSR3_9AGAR|nr:hypothetical protein BT96DRAFT_975125 [Gymnopus androsaceus JB14]
MVPLRLSPGSSSISPEELQNLLRSENSSPSTYASEIPHIVTAIDADIYRYDAQIRRLHAEITFLENKRKRAIRQQERYKSLLAPVRRLPSEIVDYIFRLYGGAFKNEISWHRLFLPGLVLMAVCARWRGIAASCNSLWTNLSLDPDIPDPSPLVEPLKWCLDHASSTSPLDFEFLGTVYDEPEDNDDKPACEIVALLVSHASRWRHVRFRTESFLDNFPSFQTLPQHDLPLLESLHLEYHADYDILAELPFFCTAGPKLSKLVLCNGLPDDDSLDDLVESFPQLSQIKNLCLEYHSGRTSHPCQSLETLLGIESLSYTFRDGYSLSPEDPPQISPSVSILKIHIESIETQPRTFGDLLDLANFPALEKLSVIFTIRDRPWEVADNCVRKFMWPEQKITSFLLRSKCSLTFLHLEDVVISNSDLVKLLMHTPMLQRFAFHQRSQRQKVSKGPRAEVTATKTKPLTMAFFKHLHAFGDSYGISNALVPKLQHLSFKVLSDWFQ